MHRNGLRLLRLLAADGHLLPGQPSCAQQTFVSELFSSTCNWSVPSLTHVFETFIAVLGIAAAIWGGWLKHAGPRKAGIISALCWGGGLFLGGVGVALHQLWMVYLFCGLVGGIGQGLGYITPVSTLLKWFPDRRGMATVSPSWAMAAAPWSAPLLRSG